MGEADDPERGEFAGAFGEGDAGVVVDHAEGDHCGEGHVDFLDEADACGGGLAEIGSERVLDGDPADAGDVLESAEEFLAVGGIDGEGGAGDDIAIAEEAVQGVEVHIGGHTGEVFGEADERD
ncbi:MAG: hypothetical protein RI897_1977 [Verrucomicrobiota bacterium]